jgi:iron(III) transport system permease protein
MLGAGPVQTGLRMTLPLVFPTIASTFLLIFVMTAENFSVPTLLGSAFGYQTLPSRIYFDMTVEPSEPTVAAAAGTMLLWIALAGTLWQRRILARASKYVTISGKGSRPRTTDLGAWKYVATGALVFYVLVAVVLPYAALVFSSFLNFLTPRITPKLFTLDNYAYLLREENVEAIINSLMFSLGGGFLITALYVTLSYLIKRAGTGTSRAVEYLVMIPTAIPAVVLAVGILWTFVGLPLPIYGTASILIIAYFIRYIGLGVRQSRTALAQVSEELSEAARMSGASPLRAFRDVTVPLVRPQALALWTLLFMSIFTEISVTILLYSYDTVTLPIRLWNDMSAGHQTRAIAVAVLQATIMFVIIFFADRKFGILRNTLDR